MLQEEIILPSGSKLQIQVAEFAKSKALFQAILKALNNVGIDTSDFGVEAMIKNALCVCFSSPEIETYLWQCFSSCLYNGVRIDAMTFEDVNNRDDYIKVCTEVVKANISPFLKSLFAEWKSGQLMAASILKSVHQTTT
jgi:hypothetical protein